MHSGFFLKLFTFKNKFKMKTLIISIFSVVLTLGFIFHVKSYNEKKYDELLILSYTNGYLNGFSNCKEDSMNYIEDSYKKDSIEFAKIVID